MSSSQSVSSPSDDGAGDVEGESLDSEENSRWCSNPSKRPAMLRRASAAEVACEAGRPPPEVKCLPH
jgi:hypothetical protein